MTIHTKRRGPLAAIATLLLLVAICLPAAASTGISNASGFTVKAVIPGNQIDENLTYFDLMVEPGQTQVLQVAVTNHDDRDIIVDVALHAASTNRNGVIEYQMDAQPDDSLQYPLNTIAHTDGELRLGPGEKKMAEIRLETPEHSFSGNILGGIVFTRRLEESGTEGMGINNQFSYVIGVKLTASDAEVERDFDLLGVEETLINYRAAVIANIQNPQPLIIKNAEATAHVYKKGVDEPIYSAVNTNVDFAPNSVFPFPVEWDGDRMDAGDYRMAVQLVHQDRVWNWDEDFRITSQQAQDVNDIAVTPVQGRNAFPWWILLLILIGILLVLFSAYYLGKKRGERRQHP